MREKIPFEKTALQQIKPFLSHSFAKAFRVVAVSKDLDLCNISKFKFMY